MNDAINSLPPWQNLALAHARREFREPFRFLLNLDNRLYSVASRGSEPLLAQMRIAWWREQLAKAAAERPAGEPLLAELGVISSAYADLNIPSAANQLVDAWEIIAINRESGSADNYRRFANLRSDAIFESYASWIEATTQEQDDASEVGQYWALASLGLSAPIAAKKRTTIRPLSILAKGAALDLVSSPWVRSIGALRLGIHALTGL